MGDLGWYLSFGSFIGVIVLAPLIHRYFWGSQESIPMMRQLVIDTLSAQIMTLPIILCSFGIFSTYALIANILILPFVPFAMLMTFITGIAGIFSQAISEVIGLPAILVLKYSTEVIARVANLPNALIEVSFNARLMIGSYILLAAIISYLTWRTHYDFRSDTQTEHI